MFDTKVGVKLPRYCINVEPMSNVSFGLLISTKWNKYIGGELLLDNVLIFLKMSCFSSYDNTYLDSSKESSSNKKRQSVRKKVS